MLTEKDIRLLSEVLWDTDLEKIDVYKNKFPIIERIICYGRPEHIRWMLEKYKEKDLIDVIRRSKNIDKKSIAYWAIRLKIPIQETVCITKPSVMK